MKKRWYLGMMSLLALTTLASCGENYGLVFDKDGNGLHYAQVYKGNGVRPGMKITIA